MFCKYHIVFAPKFRRKLVLNVGQSSLLELDDLRTKFAEGKVFYENKRLEVGKILRDLCNWKGINIIEAEVCPDHIHMFVEIPPKISVSGFMGYLKGKSSLMIYEKWSNMKHEAEK